MGGGEGHARATGVEAAAAEWEAAGGERQAGSGGQTGSAYERSAASLTAAVSTAGEWCPS